MNWPSYLLLICRRKSTFYYIFLIFLLLLQEVIGHLLPDYDITRVLLLLVALILPLLTTNSLKLIQTFICRLSLRRSDNEI